MKYPILLKRYSILKELGAKVLPRKVSYAIARNLVKIEKELELYHNQRHDIGDRYAKKDDSGAYVIVDSQYTFASDEDKEMFLAEVRELDETEIEIEFVMFDAEELDKCDKSSRYEMLTPLQEASISWMIDYE